MRIVMLLVQRLRALMFAGAQVLLTPLFALVALATFPLPHLQRYRLIRYYAYTMLYLARVICGIRYRVLHAERIPPGPCVVLAKHQSAWETFAFQKILPPQVWVLKRELLWIPFFGWGLALTRPIAIDRAAGARAFRQLLAQGRDRLASGFWVVVFPEGTRVAPGASAPYHPGGAHLAARTGTTVLPVAHNAGYCWGKGWLEKRPGLVTVSIGPPIDPHGLTTEEINRRAREWIEAEVRRMGSAAEADLQGAARSA